MYKTTDIDVRHAPDMLAFCNDALAVAIVPTLAACFQIEESDMEVDDLFVVKYQDAKNGADGHDQESRVALAPHRDDSVLSFVIPLNTMGRTLLVVALSLSIGSRVHSWRRRRTLEPLWHFAGCRGMQGGASPAARGTFWPGLSSAGGCARRQRNYSQGDENAGRNQIRAVLAGCAKSMGCQR